MIKNTFRTSRNYQNISPNRRSDPLRGKRCCIIYQFSPLNHGDPLLSCSATYVLCVPVKSHLGNLHENCLMDRFKQNQPCWFPRVEGANCCVAICSEIHRNRGEKLWWRLEREQNRVRGDFSHQEAAGRVNRAPDDGRTNSVFNGFGLLVTDWR